MSLIRYQLEASIAHEEWKARHKQPDLSNDADTDVLGWLQSVELHAQEFHDEYERRACSGCGFDEYAEDIVMDAKRLISTMHEARARQAEIDSRG